jgi:hypothetical protein
MLDKTPTPDVVSPDLLDGAIDEFGKKLAEVDIGRAFNEEVVVVNES